MSSYSPQQLEAATAKAMADPTVQQIWKAWQAHRAQTGSWGVGRADVYGPKLGAALKAAGAPDDTEMTFKDGQPVLRNQNLPSWVWPVAIAAGAGTAGAATGAFGGAAAAAPVVGGGATAPGTVGAAMVGGGLPAAAAAPAAALAPHVGSIGSMLTPSLIANGVNAGLGIYGMRAQSNANKDALAMQQQGNADQLAFLKEQAAEDKRRFDATQAQNLGIYNDERDYTRGLETQRRSRLAPYVQLGRNAMGQLAQPMARGRVSDLL